VLTCCAAVDSQSVKQFETSQRLQRALVRSVLVAHFHSRPARHLLLDTHILPDIEGSSLRVDRALLPVVRKLKFALQRDALSRQVRADGGPHVEPWLVRNAARMSLESERVRLAVCPSSRRIVRFWEALTRATSA